MTGRKERIKMESKQGEDRRGKETRRGKQRGMRRMSDGHEKGGGGSEGVTKGVRGEERMVKVTLEQRMTSAVSEL